MSDGPTLADDGTTKQHGWRAKELREWEKGTRKLDLEEEFRQLNKGLLQNYGKEGWMYKPELTDASHRYWKQNEARYAHGYPMTAWM